jgi:hypothetical protein
LSENNKNIHYIPAVRHGEPLEAKKGDNKSVADNDIISGDIIPFDLSVYSGEIVNLIKEKHPNLKGWQVFLSGNPDMVKKAQRECFFLGASVGDIFADAFTVQAIQIKNNN